MAMCSNLGGKKLVGLWMISCDGYTLSMAYNRISAPTHKNLQVFGSSVLQSQDFDYLWFLIEILFQKVCLSERYSQHCQKDENIPYLCTRQPIVFNCLQIMI